MLKTVLILIAEALAKVIVVLLLQGGGSVYSLCLLNEVGFTIFFMNLSVLNEFLSVFQHGFMPNQ